MSRLEDLISRRRLHRRHLLQFMGMSGVGLLAACASKSSTGGNATSTSSSGGAATTAPTTASSGGGATAAASAAAGASPAATSAATTAPTAAAAAKKKGGTLTVGLDQEPPTMDPHASPSAITFYITGSTAESLLYLDNKRQLQPWLASKYEVSTDAKTFTYHLVTDATFQDGAPFNSQAVKYSFDRIVDPNFKAGGALGSLSGYTGTDTPDDNTAVIKFKAAFVPFLTYSSGGTLAFVSPKTTPTQGDAVNHTPVTSGPYKITEYVAKDHCTIERWDGYKRKLPWASQAGPGYLDKVVWKFIPEAGTRTTTVQSGETQAATVIASQDLPTFENNKSYIVMKPAWVGTPEIWLLTVDHPPTDDVKVRQAINYAVNKQAIVDTVYRGTATPAIGVLAKSMLDDPSLQNYPFDQAKAKQLLDEAGWTAGSGGMREKNGQKLTIVINAIDYGGGPATEVPLIQGQLRDVGIDAQIKAQARPPWYDDNYKGATNGPIMFLRSGDWDGLYALFHSSNIGGNFNWSRVKDPDVDAALVKGREESDPAKRKQLYVDLCKKLLNDMAAAVPLLDQLSVWVIRANYPGMIFNGSTYPIITEMTTS